MKISVADESANSLSDQMESVNITDEEKEKMKTSYSEQSGENPNQNDTSNRPFLDTVLEALDCNENDYLALLSLCLLYALANNKGKILFALRLSIEFCVIWLLITKKK